MGTVYVWTRAATMLSATVPITEGVELTWSSRMIRLNALVLALTVSIACSGGSTPTSPTAPPAAVAPTPPPAPPPAPSLASLTGVVMVTGSNVRVTGVTIRVLDGPNSGRTAVTDSTGYRFTGLTPGNANFAASSTGWEESRAGVYVDGSNSLNFSIRTINPYMRVGAGDEAFDIPPYLTRVRVIGTYSGFVQNFIVNCGNFSGFLVNEIIGTSRNTTRFEGVYNTNGCTSVAITSSSGVSWSITEVR